MVGDVAYSWPATGTARGPFATRCETPARSPSRLGVVFVFVVQVLPIPRHESNDMQTHPIVAIVLIVAGLLGMTYRGFSDGKEATGSKLGPIELKVTDTKTVNVPLWAGIGAMLASGVWLVLGVRQN